ncbi:hypothetical protein M413DRAFT_428973 [Hebeloma cylindrosporum]|uniref:Sacsin/Nov domain-containing protein n=1 Tax=Hebeloma cylindrosporum TaxID=76867 RepID=A0A0C3CM47_HEBCY|nr:hypothetical protein M413DRAFT_428973 [Hebeloma cylindrosporum h7]
MVVSKDKLWESGHDETVEVNQRALIDKVLARYSGEFTVFRELLQNSDDARSAAVEIRFETQAFLSTKTGDIDIGNSVTSPNLETQLPDLKTTHVHQWTFKNNGMEFRDEDWNRLKKIAEGNPDEEKIGAFGVGFYSLFSVTEEPFVTSGGQWMGFYWKDKKDQLFARRGRLPESDADPQSKSWTSFTMALREPAPIPVAFDFTRFLASSLTFMSHLCEVSVYFDDKRLVRLYKSSGIPRDLGIPKGLNNRSPSGIMTVDNIQSTPLYIQAQVMKWIYTSGTEKKRINPLKSTTANKPPASGGGFFSSIFSSLSGSSTPQRVVTALPPPVPPKPIDHLAINETNVSLSIYSASIQVRLDKKLSSEIQRSTKKNPPTKMKFELIYTAKDEYDASLEEDAKQPEATGSIFQGLRADLDGVGAARVFIGHSTAQSTGVGGHVAARFIPTVERESIDFMDRNVAVWNKELLYVGGLLSRAVYEFELSTVRQHWETAGSGNGPLGEEMQRSLIGRVLHALKFFMFYTSTPSPDVSSLMEAAFFACSPSGNFPLITTKGVRHAANVRLPDSTFSGFLKDIPTVPEEIMNGASLMISGLQARGLIKAITFHDVLQELQSRPLTQTEFVACLNWWIGVFQEGDRDRLLPIRAQLINSVVLSTVDEGSGQKIIALSAIKSFINPRAPSGNIPPEGPLPEHLLPISISKSFKPEVLSSCFPWTEFTIVQWVRFLCEFEASQVEFDLNLSPSWAERVFGMVSRAWPTLSSTSKTDIIQLLRLKTCIPTSSGMMLPEQAYFPNVNIFGDLPIVVFPAGLLVKGTLERVLQDIGVRKHVELQLIFNRMIKTNEWTIADLTKYLVSVKGSLTPEEIERLKATSAFPTEVQNPEINNKKTRYRANQLYEPLDVFRTLSLPVIDWGQNTKWRSSSEEAKFLFDLGLLRYPPLEKLIYLCSTEDASIRTAALKYLIDNVASRYQDYDPMNFKDVRFIPALNGRDHCLGTVQEVFSAPWSAVNFLALQPAYQPHANKLKIKDHPPAPQLISRLQSKPPESAAEARSLFGLLAGRVQDFKSSDLRTLSATAFVPVLAEKGVAGPSLRWLPPSQCYLAGETHAAFHSKLFTFVDFGSAANAFLMACGTRNHPSVEEIAKILLADPRQFYQLAQGPIDFLSELRNLAVNSKSISQGTMLRMKRAPILLGLQRKPRKQMKPADDWDEEEWDIQYELKKPSEVIIADDTHAYQAFGDSLFTAPQEDIIEDFYVQLGSSRLSRVVREEYQPTAELNDSKQAGETRTLILERLPLFLHEHTHTRTRVAFSWFSADRNFTVKAFGKLGVVKHLSHGQFNLSKKQDASAVARRSGTGPIELWIAGNSQIDMYEVASSLNRLLFDSPKANDALLFMTILSTDLRSLKRRGYNVDRILRQQRDARLAAESARLAKQEENRLLSQPSDVHAPDLKETRLDSNQSPIVSTEGKSKAPLPFSNPFQNLRRKIGSMATSQQTTGPVKEGLSLPTSVDSNPGGQPEIKGDMSGIAASGGLATPEARVEPNPTRIPDSGSGVTPWSNISKNIEMAINSCKAESSNLLENREHMQRVKETLNDGYCDVSGRKGNLHNIGQMGSVNIYLSEEIPVDQAEPFMAAKRQSLARFIHIMTPLANIYQLSITNLHIFYDQKGGVIAFNRNGSIFLNLRYYEEWHDADVKHEKLQSAFISWYFTIAHEIAHNLVQPHNSEREFYFSAICERFIVQLGHLLSNSR